MPTASTGGQLNVGLLNYSECGKGSKLVTQKKKTSEQLHKAQIIP